MKADVFFIRARSDENPESLSDKGLRVLQKTGFLEKLEPQDFVALKMHFGEKGNTGFIRPAWLRSLAAEIGRRTPRAFLADSNTLYLGPRSNSVEHLKLAWSHGFRPDVLGLPVIIADGLIGNDAREAPGGTGRVAAAKIASAFLGADALLGLAHVTGHVQTGIGAAIKNIGMGCASRAGKLDQHSAAHPRFQAKACRDCGVCLLHCPARAITRAEGHAVLNDGLCIGCGECLVVCRHGAIKVRWDEDLRRVQEKIAEYARLVVQHFGRKAAFLNFAVHITKDCDCMAKDQPFIVEDLGILASTDPVAVDKAAADLVLAGAGGEDPFRKGYDVDWSFQLRHGQDIGLGSLNYRLVEVGGRGSEARP